MLDTTYSSIYEDIGTFVPQLLEQIWVGHFNEVGSFTILGGDLGTTSAMG